jgi:hypothetical protein
LVIVDGVRVGTAPLADPIELDPGEHALQVRLDGYDEHVEELTIEQGTSVTFELSLRPLPARLTITGSPAETIIELDGVRVGTLPLDRVIEILPGRHVIRAVAEGFEPSVREVVALPGAETSVNIEPGQPLPYGRLRVVGAEDATVTLDDEPAGSLPLDLEIASGERRLAIEGEGLNRWEGDVVVRPGEVTEAQVRLGRVAGGPHLAWVFSLAGLSLVAGALALGFGLAALDAEQTYEATLSRIGDHDYSGRLHLDDLQILGRDAARRSSNFAITCDVSWSVALTSAVVAVILSLVRRPQDDGPNVTVSHSFDDGESERRETE